MRFNRWMGMLIALALLLSGFAAIAETAVAPDASPLTAADAPLPTENASEPAPDASEPAPDAAEPAPDASEPAPDASEPAPDAAEPAPTAAEPAEAVRTKLYVVLADCGMALYGEGQAQPHATVTAPGDPDGMLLNLAEDVLPKLVEEDAKICFYGYNDALRSAEAVAPVSVGDAAAIAAQVDALRQLSGRQSSLLHTALDALAPSLRDWQNEYDCQLILLTGGGLHYAGADKMSGELAQNPAPLDQLGGRIAELRAAGVTVTAYGIDLAQSPRANAENSRLSSLVFTRDQLGEGFKLTASVAGKTDAELLLAVASDMLDDLFALKGAREGVKYEPKAGALCNIDLSAAKSGDFGVICSAATGRFTLSAGDELAALKAQAGEGDVIRLYVSDQPEKPTLEPVLAALDADGDGALDGGLEAGATRSFPMPEGAALANYTFSAAGEAALTISTGGESLLNLTGAGAGTATLRIALAADPGVAAELSVSIADYSITWYADDGAALPVGQEALIAGCDPSNVLEASVTGGSGPIDGWRTAAAPNELRLTPDAPAAIQVTVSVGGRSAETRTFTVQYAISAPERSLTLKFPYFAQQPDQTVQILDDSGSPVSLEGFVWDAPRLADVYVSADGLTLYLAPKAAGSEDVALTHSATGQTYTLHLTVNRLTAGAPFWLLAAGVPVCLIGLTVMIVLLIVKCRGRRR